MKIPIIIAYGVEFRDLPHRSDLEDELNKLTGGSGPAHWVYKRGKKEYDISIVFTKTGFANALNTEGAIVIYDGHARWGQGPAFSDSAAPKCPDPTAFPVNPWENHFRMGYDIVATPCVEDIFTHGTDPVEYGASKPPAFVSGSVENVLKKAAAGSGKCAGKEFYNRRKLSACAAAPAAKTNCRGQKTLEKRHFWYILNNPHTGDPDYYTLVKVGDSDLSASKLRCKVLFLNSCSSLPRFYAPLLRQKKKVKSDCVFYLTHRTAYPNLARATNTFVRMVLAGSEPTQKKDAQKLLKAMNAVNPGIFKAKKIKFATGIIVLRW